MLDTHCRYFASRFLRVSFLKGLVVIFHQLHPEPVFLTDAQWVEFNRTLDSGGYQSTAHELLSVFLRKKLLIANKGVDDQVLADSRQTIARALHRPTILYLMLAQSCNWGCVGCPITDLAKQYGERLLSLEDAKCGIKLWQHHVADYPKDDEPFFIILYGGEPLLNQQLFTELLPFIDHERLFGKMPKKLELMLCTNGQLIDEKVTRLLKRYHVQVAIGMDGPEASNNLSRKTREDGPTSKLIMESVRRLVRGGIKVVVSSTITPDNLSFLSDFSGDLQRLGVSGFGFNLLKGSALRQLSSDELQKYARASAQLVLRSRAHNERSSFYEYQLEKRLHALISATPFAVDCTCYGNQLVVQPDG